MRYKPINYKSLALACIVALVFVLMLALMTLATDKNKTIHQQEATIAKQKDKIQELKDDKAMLTDRNAKLEEKVKKQREFVEDLITGANNEYLSKLVKELGGIP